MTQLQAFYILIPAAYLLGSLPMGLFVGLAKGIDPRKSGSGNIGATNLGRLLGAKYFAIVFTLDFLKGMIPVLAAGWLLNFHPQDRTGYGLWIITAFAAILGHSFSIFLGFTGGKGVSTSGGVVFGVFPYLAIPAALALLVFLIVLGTTRFMSVASMIGTIALPIAYVAIGLWQGWPILSDQTPVLGLSLLIPTLIVYKHRTNIQRLRAGTESRFKVKEKMRVKVNGSQENLPDESNINSLLTLRGLKPDKVAVELNRKLVRAQKYDTILKEGDELEIVTFVGGG